MAEMLERQLAHERERFLSSGGGPARVRAEVVSSWRRCLSWSVPVDGLIPPYRPEVDRESPLLRAARPVLDSVVERLGDLQISFLLSDAEGRILDRLAKETALVRLLDARNVGPGFVFGEDVTGTNGVGTAIELGRTTRIDGYEHYSSDLVAFTCVGVPIIDPLRQRCVGVLDVTCAADRDNRLVTLVAEQTARAIESRLLEQQSRRERALLAQFLQASRPGHGGVVVINERVVLANPRAARLLEGVDQAVLWDDAARVGDGPVWGELALADGRVACTRTTPLHDGGELVGAMIELRPSAYDRDPLPGRPSADDDTLHRLRRTLLGRDPVFVEALRRAGAVAPGSVLVLCGEPGTGKRTLAVAAGCARHGAEPHEADAAAAVQDGEASWLAGLGSVLGGRPGGIVVRHVELLSASAMRTLAALLATAGGRGWWCAVTATGPDAPLLPGVEQETAWMPPLRDRRGDLAALVAAIAAPATVAPEVVQLLARLSWPGNVRDLRAAVSRIVAAAPDGPRIGLASVPNDLRRAATRATLTRFERAEVHAILEALAETRGNKKEAAILLGISRTTLYRKLQSAGVDLENTVY
jgi:transcriptional regulator of acetoin/glycerol metabolism